MPLVGSRVGVLPPALQSRRVPPTTNLSPLRLPAGPMEFGAFSGGQPASRSRFHSSSDTPQRLASPLPGIAGMSQPRDRRGGARCPGLEPSQPFGRNGEALPSETECPFCRSISSSSLERSLNSGPMSFRGGHCVGHCPHLCAISPGKARPPDSLSLPCRGHPRPPARGFSRTKGGV